MKKVDRLIALIKNRKFINYIILFGGLSGYLINFYVFRSQLHDFGDYIKAGELIWNRQNPYSQLMYVNSPVSAVYVYILSKVFFFLHFPVIIQILNVAGLYFFLTQVLRASLSHSIFLAFALLPFLSPARALFANVQVTGLVLGLLAFAIFLSRRGKPEFLTAVPMWMAAELKPHMALPIILILVFERRLNLKRIALLSSYVVAAHTIVSIHFGALLDLEWIRKLMKYSDSSYKEGYEISYWKALAIYSGQEGVVKILSLTTIAIFILCMIIFSLKGRIGDAILISLLYPLQNSYLHLYDLVPIALALTVLGLKNRNILAIAPIFFLAQFFVLDIPSQLITGLLSFVFFLVLTERKKNSLRNLNVLLATIGIAIGSYLMFKGVSEELQIAFTLVIPLAICFILSRHPIQGLLRNILGERNPVLDTN